MIEGKEENGNAKGARVHIQNSRQTIKRLVRSIDFRKIVRTWVVFGVDDG